MIFIQKFYQKLYPGNFIFVKYDYFCNHISQNEKFYCQRNIG